MWILDKLRVNQYRLKQDQATIEVSADNIYFHSFELRKDSNLRAETIKNFHALNIDENSII